MKLFFLLFAFLANYWYVFVILGVAASLAKLIANNIHII